MRSCSCPRSWLHALERALPAVAAAVLCGCAALGAYRDEPARTHLAGPTGSPAAECARLFEDLDDAVAKAGVHDAGASIVNGHPYLRADRFIASFAADAASERAFDDWVAWMLRLDEQARSIELANLGAPFPDSGAGDTLARLRDCRAMLAAADLREDSGRRRLRESVVVPPDYAAWKRVLGLYALTRIPFASGIRAWQQRTAAEFAAPLAALPLRGTLVRYGAARGGERPDPSAVAAALARAPRNALAVPLLPAADLERLFAAFAPEIEIDVAGEDDRPGALGYGADGTLRVDPARPTVYRRASFARYGDRVLLQLDYSLWFAARTPESAFDLLSGAFDGITWRVTLGEDGTPLVFDSMHNCGCYHLFFPTPSAVPRAKPDTIDEWMFSPQALPRLSAADTVTLRLESRTHYLQRVRIGAPPAADPARYAFEDDDRLRSLPLPAGGTRSAFGPEGIVAGSERGERFLYWPMGVRDPGAMRQWGRHATAFVGMRHFDDPGLIERYFELPAAALAHARRSVPE